MLQTPQQNHLNKNLGQNLQYSVKLCCNSFIGSLPCNIIAIIRQALINHHFYQLSYDILSKILTLLDYPPSELASYIQQYCIRGFLKIAITYSKRQVSNHFRQHRFNSIPDNVKNYVMQIANQVRDVVMENRKAQPLFGTLNENQQQFLRINQHANLSLQQNQQNPQEQGNDSDQDDSEEESIMVEMVDAAVQTDLNLQQEEFIVFPREKNASNFFIDDEAQYEVFMKKNLRRQRMLQKKREKKQLENRIKKQLSRVQKQSSQDKQKQGIEEGAREQPQQQKIVVQENQWLISDQKLNQQKEEKHQKEIESICQSGKNKHQNYLTFNLKQLLQLHQVNSIQNSLQKQPTCKFPSQSNNAAIKFQNCPCGRQQQQTLPFYKCIECCQYFHFECTGQQPNLSSSNSCHNCLLKSLIPHHQVVEQLFHGSLKRDGLTSLDAVINVNPYHYYCNLFFRKYEIQLRCISITPDKQSNNDLIVTSMLHLLSVKINNSFPEEYSITDTPDLQMVKNKRKYSLFLTKQAYPIQADKNSLYKTPISFSLQPKVGVSGITTPGPVYFFGVYFIKKLQTEEIQQKLTANLKIADIDMYTRMLDLQQVEKVSCPLWRAKTKAVFRVPVRGSKCCHLECFDLSQYARLIGEWKTDIKKCLICQQKMKDIVVDPLQKYLIGQATACNKHPKTAIFYKNGTILVDLATQEELAIENRKEETKKKSTKKQIKKKGQYKINKEAIAAWIKSGKQQPNRDIDHID